jgi:glycosyltransferase involved in cell wall biosynthesis
MTQKPVRILHVVGGMNRGGVETWLMHVLRNIDRDKYKMDFMVHTTEPCAYDDEIRALGSKIIPCPNPRRPLAYARQFRDLYKEHGPYDVVHSHVHHFSGFVLWLAKREQVPVRIAHSHNDTLSSESAASAQRRSYLSLTEYLVRRNASKGLACSKKAARALYGAEWKSDARWRLLLYGIDLHPFKEPTEPATLRASLGLPEQAYVIGHVGRFVHQKNHPFLLDIFAEVVRHEPCAHLFLVGLGPLAEGTKRRAEALGIMDKVTFAGSRSNVPQLMMGAMDVFAFPSHYEGLGLVLIEAQAAGLPCVFSDVVPEEADVVQPLVHRLSLSDPATKWAEAILKLRHQPRAISRQDALKIVENSPFNIDRSVRALEAIYDGKQ